jgi:hypothetical protein
MRPHVKTFLCSRVCQILINTDVVASLSWDWRLTNGFGTLITDLLKEYRQLDDTINMRLNRTNAQFRDAEREGKSQQQRQQGTVADEACAYVFLACWLGCTSHVLLVLQRIGNAALPL